ncbi:unnamed protein product [Strongylus vulgaris]|uniref:L-Fucosyltransferase n=1 Tax=Strongylus vulgaris TaxID=40348 RepID=A0A3P7JRX2_STRVU|nr:unnamed protein product [Strongylus vulgaris]
MFELMGFIGIALQVKRIPIILEPYQLQRIDNISEYFPNIGSRFQRKEICQSHVYISTPLEFCCRHDIRIVKRLEEKTFIHSVAIQLRYLQSYKYFWNLRREAILHIIGGSNQTIFMADTQLFPKNRLRRRQSNICVHIRRGDFTGSKMHRASDAEFSLAAMRFVVEKTISEDSRPPHIYVFTDSIEWTKENVVEPYIAANISWSAPLIAADFADKAPNTEWEFSRMYCDRVLLTASTSTYGWWIAYFSRGQKVYYSTRHGSPGAHPREFLSTDFFPQHWRPLSSHGSEVIEL